MHVCNPACTQTSAHAHACAHLCTKHQLSEVLDKIMQHALEPGRGRQPPAGLFFLPKPEVFLKWFWLSPKLFKSSSGWAGKVTDPPELP
ncbi:hypothetical protein DUNSADRAFT_8907 [Dunaliella salina]|uniref:Encoded protein n=1 Tax=Dunaliella salina TaxID=3046 RepID=A0ABQ7GIR7_DUNSA|nr:hypothetical protein DUNSADRAFT_8907 [Dunaliella salina]|eukprot:KAF5834444.1 hypothetical protein DUNSADRAFT_8907 [Dunaliella salina]